MGGGIKRKQWREWRAGEKKDETRVTETGLHRQATSPQAELLRQSKLLSSKSILLVPFWDIFRSVSRNTRGTKGRHPWHTHEHHHAEARVAQPGAEGGKEQGRAGKCVISYVDKNFSIPIKAFFRNRCRPSLLARRRQYTAVCVALAANMIVC